MKRPWQIWTLFVLGLAAVIPAMAWLTVKAVELDRAEALARQQAELEEDVSRALWRLDALLTPILAEEAARPDFVYQPVCAVNQEGGKSAAKAISPLLLQPPEFVRLHFELHPDGQLTSPQCPTGAELAWTERNGASHDAIAAARSNLTQLSGALSHQRLIAMLPEQALPELVVAAGPLGNSVLSEENVRFAANAYGEQQAGPPPTPPQAFQQASDSLDNTQQTAIPQALPNSAQQTQSAGPQQSAYGQNRLQQRQQARLGNDLSRRDAAYQAFASKVAVEQRQNLNAVVQPERVIEGVSRPLWIDDRLILARRVKVGDKTLIQGCWLDWERLRGELLGAIADLTPEATLKPVTALEPQSLSRVLATLPVQLSVPPPTIAAAPRSSMRLALILAWTCLVAAAVAAAVMLWSVVALSERRGAFVAAVTHELRTPLTTFRMYAEMLADGMVPDAEQRQRYLETLRAEADRLAHLVDNVLQYARLERTNPDRRREKLPLGDLIDRMRGRLTSRTHEAGMVLKVAIDDATAETTVDLDVAAVEQIVFNLVDNACKYAAHAGDRRIHLEVVAEGRQAVIRVRDHGPGISRLGRRKLFRPFSKSVHEAANSAPGVGLGLALCRRLARHLGGRLTLAESNEGAVFELRLPL